MKMHILMFPFVALLVLFISSCGPRPTAEGPPANASVGDTWTSPADGMTMVYVPAGEFEMGSDDGEVDYALQLCNQYVDCERGWFETELPVHTVALDGFWIGQTEVTNAQYQRCVEAGACDEPACWDDENFSASDQPVVCVTWDEAQAYSEWVGGRLPTEAEWEYAACGSEEWRYPWGDEFDGTRLSYCDANCDRDWADETFSDGYAYTAPVGSFPSGVSWCGALDMSGNVLEWTVDWFTDYSSEAQLNPAGPSSGEYRVLRGAAWSSSRTYARCAFRAVFRPDVSDNRMGFRVVFGTPLPFDTSTSEMRFTGKLVTID